MDFQEADRRYVDLKRQFDAGSIGVDEFNAERQRLMVQDDEGRWWARSPNNDEWSYYDGTAWVPATPPGYQPPERLAAESASDGESPPMQSERALQPQTTLRGSTPVQDRTRGKQHRGVRRWAIVAVVFMGVALLEGIGIVAIMDGEGAQPASGYNLAKDDSGKLSVEVPSEWKERITSTAEGERGEAWASFAGENVLSIAAVNDIHSWRTGSRGHEGTFITASKKLGQRYTDDELIVMGPNDYSSSCEADTPRDFNRSPYSGRMLSWKNCGGDSDHNALTLAAAPEGRECVVVLQVGGYLPTNDEKVWHVLDTFDADCRGIT